jgi:serine/threonine protein kinase
VLHMSSKEESNPDVSDATGQLVDPKETTVIVPADSHTNTFDETSQNDAGEGRIDLKAKILAKLEASQEEADDTDTLIGQEIAGRFTVTTRIGEGGMGVVYKARQKNMDRDIAIKVLLAEMAANKTVEKRFYLEALAVSKLKHPNTIQIFDFGETEKGQLYIAMEFLDGSGLKEVLQEDKTFAAQRAGKVVIQILKSLREAHAKGIVHRDLKPDNIFLCTVGDQVDFVKVLDFGVAKLKEGDESKATLTKTGAIFGTPRYMSPEQSVSANVDQRSDLYAIGVMFYEMLAGRAPFEAEMPLSLLIMHVQDPVPSFNEVRPDLVIPPELETFTRKLLEKDPNNRYATAEAAIRALEDILSGLDDIYRTVVTTDYAEKIGLEVASPVPTLSNTILNPSHAQLQRTMVAEDGTELIESGVVPQSPLKWVFLVLFLLVGGGIAFTLSQPPETTPEKATARQEAVPSPKVEDVTAPKADLDVQEAPPVPQEINVTITTQPAGAVLWDGPTKVGATPFTAKRPHDDSKETVWRVSLDGYEDATVRFKPVQDVQASLMLAKAAKKRPIGRRPSGPRKPKAPIAKPTPLKVEVKAPVVKEVKPQPVIKKKPKDPFLFGKEKETKGLGF